MQEIKTYADITRAANAMQREREITQYSPLTEPDRFEKSFREIFAGDEGYEKPKHQTSVDIHADHGHSIHDF